jgi:hypothetical protein
MDSRQRLMEVRRRWWWIIHGDGRTTTAACVTTIGLRATSGSRDACICTYGVQISQGQNWNMKSKYMYFLEKSD